MEGDGLEPEPEPEVSAGAGGGGVAVSPPCPPPSPPSRPVPCCAAGALTRLFVYVFICVFICAFIYLFILTFGGTSESRWPPWCQRGGGGVSVLEVLRASGGRRAGLGLSAGRVGLLLRGDTVACSSAGP